MHRECAKCANEFDQTGSDLVCQRCVRFSPGFHMRTIKEVLADPSTSTWLKCALSSALDRDPIDAARDAEQMYELLERHADDVLRRSVL